MEKLKEHLQVDNFRKKLTSIKNERNEPIDFVRNGNVGDWRVFFTEDMKNKTDKWIQANCEDIGILFPE